MYPIDGTRWQIPDTIDYEIPSVFMNSVCQYDCLELVVLSLLQTTHKLFNDERRFPDTLFMSLKL